MTCPTVLFLKAQIKGGAGGDLFATPVTVAPHVRDGKVVPGYTAIRHKAAPEAPPELAPAASNAAAKSDTFSGEATQGDTARFAAVSAAYVARRAAREAAKAAYVVPGVRSMADHPLAIALEEAEAAVAREEIAARVAAEGERDRARDAADDLRVIAEGLVRENERLLRAAGLNPDWSVVPAHLVRKYSAALTPAPEAPTDGDPYAWKGEGPQPARWTAADGTIVYRSYGDYVDD